MLDEELVEPKLLVRNETAFYRTNDPLEPYLGRCTAPSRSALARALKQPATGAFNAAVGLSSPDETMPTAGIAGLILKLEPEAALAVYDSLDKDGPPTLVAIAATLLDLPAEASATALLAGPAWAGDMAGWIRPDEAALAVRHAAAGEATSGIWKHLKREVIQRLETAYDPYTEAGRLRLALRQREEPDTRPDGIESLFPQTVIDANASVDATARIGDGVTIETGVEIGRLAAIGNGSRIGADTKVGAHAVVGAGVSIDGTRVIGAGARIGDRAVTLGGARLGEKAQVEAEARVGAGVQLGPASLAGRNSRIGDNVNLGQDAVVGAKATIGNNSQIGENVRIGWRSVIGNGARINEADIDDHVHVSAGADIHGSQEADAYTTEHVDTDE